MSHNKALEAIGAVCLSIDHINQIIVIYLALAVTYKDSSVKMKLTRGPVVTGTAAPRSDKEVLRIVKIAVF